MRAMTVRPERATRPSRRPLGAARARSGSGTSPALPARSAAAARAVLSAALAAGLVLAGGASPGSAAPDHPVPGVGEVYLTSGTPTATQLSAATAGGPSLTFAPRGTATTGQAHQGLAFRASDRRLYAVEVPVLTDGSVPAAAPRLLTVSRSGVTTPLGALESLSGGTSFVAGGTFGEGARADTYLAVVVDEPARTTSGLLAVEIGADGTLTETLVPLDLPTGAVLGDLAPVGGFVWALTGQQVVRIDPADGAVSMWTLPEGTVEPGDEVVYGAAWASGGGEMSFGSGHTGQVTRLRVTDPASAEPTLEVVARHVAPIGTQSDGTFAPVPVVTTGPAQDEVPARRGPPAAPHIDPTDGTQVSGAGVPGHTVTVTFPDGSTAQTTVGHDQRWTVPLPDVVFVHGHLIEARSTDASGVTSEPACTTVDLIPPEAPPGSDVRGPGPGGASSPAGGRP